MANANITRPIQETLPTTGTVTPNSTARKKILIMTNDVTLNAPTGATPGDEFTYLIKLGGNLLTLNGYTSWLSTPTTILEDTVMDCWVADDGTLYQWIVRTSA